MCFDKNTIFQIFSCPKKVFQSKYFLLKTQLTTTRGLLGGKAKAQTFICRSISETASWYEGRHIYDDFGYLRLRLKDSVTKVVSDCRRWWFGDLGGAVWCLVQYGLVQYDLVTWVVQYGGHQAGGDMNMQPVAAPSPHATKAPPPPNHHQVHHHHQHIRGHQQRG